MIHLSYSKATKIFLLLVLICNNCKIFCTEKTSEGLLPVFASKKEASSSFIETTEDRSGWQKSEGLLPEKEEIVHETNRAKSFLVRMTPIALACSVGMITGRISSLLEKKELLPTLFSWPFCCYLRIKVLDALKEDMDLYDFPHNKKLMNYLAWIADWMAYALG